MNWIGYGLALLIGILLGFLIGGFVMLDTFVKPIINDALSCTNYFVKVSKMYLDELRLFWRANKDKPIGNPSQSAEKE